jgi:hypothetical protein
MLANRLVGLSGAKGRSVSCQTSSVIRQLFELASDNELRGRDPIEIWIGDFVAGDRIRIRAKVISQRTK